MIYSSQNSVSETTGFGLNGMLEGAFVSEQQWSSSREQRSSYVSNDFKSSHFSVAKLSLYSACSSWEKIAFDRWREYVLL